MMIIPVRKCFLLIKICFMLMLVACILSLFKQCLDEVLFEIQIREDEARIIAGLGEGGDPAALNETDKEKGEESVKKYAMNVYLSDRMPYSRTIKDIRNPLCRYAVYDAELPSASVIIIFHNEPYSVLLRTIWSVLNSVRRDQPWYKKANYIVNSTGARMEMGYKDQPSDSLYLYLKEIILVDDYSNVPELKGKLSYYIKTRFPRDMIRLLRFPERRGLIRARNAGASIARGDVIVVLDSHSEPVRDWLRPLLHRIKQKRTAVVTPIIDTIIPENFAFSMLGNRLFMVCGFTFGGLFKNIPVSEREKKRRGANVEYPILPTWSPTMAGGLFAMDREYFWELGGYDEMMSIWGGENLEMAFRVWQCGGTIEKIPCSRVGHVCRLFTPYEVPKPDPHFINVARMAEVWMDEFAEIFYIHRPELRNSPKIGDVSRRKALREKLHCKSFQWYLDNVFPEKFVPIQNDYAYGRFRTKVHGRCVDNLQRPLGSPLGMYGCHPQLSESQWFSLTLTGQLRNEWDCAEVSYTGDDTDGHPVLLMRCPDADPRTANERQVWSYSKGIIMNVGSKLCLTSNEVAGSDLLVKRCDGSPEQLWDIDYSEDNNFKWDIRHYSGSIERQARIRKLRGHRRTSRSLLSVDDNRVQEPSIASNTLHRRSRRKELKKQNHIWKNKFTRKEEGTGLLSNWSVLTERKNPHHPMKVR